MEYKFLGRTGVRVSALCFGTMSFGGDADEDFTNFARERGYDPASLAVAWVAGHPTVTTPIIGARNLKQLESSLKSIDIDMTPELRAELSALSPEPPPATDRNEERMAHNFEQR